MAVAGWARRDMLGRDAAATSVHHLDPHMGEPTTSTSFPRT